MLLKMTSIQLSNIAIVFSIFGIFTELFMPALAPHSCLSGTDDFFQDFVVYFLIIGLAIKLRKYEWG